MKALAVLALTFAAAPSVPPFEDGAEDLKAVQEFVRSVQSAEGEALDVAIGQVREQLADRRRKDASRAGTALLHYTLGYLGESRARLSPDTDDAQRHLRMAAAAYYRFLTLEPGHLEGARAAARVFERIGRPGPAAELILVQADEAEPGVRGALLRLAGGLLAADGAWRRGLQTMGAARRAGVDALELQQDLQRLYEDVALRELDAEGLAWLDEWCDKLADGGAPAAALPGWRVVMRAAPGLDASAVGSDALASWTLYAGELDVLNGGSIEALGVELPGVRALRALFGEDAALPELGSDTWGEDARAIAAAASAARARSRVAEQAGNYELAQEVLWRGLELAMYSEDGEPMLRVLLDLALLYGRRPEIDPEGRGFEQVEGILFMEKNQAYLRGDAATIERTHRIFAQIYIQRGAVVGEGLTAAPYHVDRARDAARERVGRGADFEPYPELSELLAEGLEIASASFGAMRLMERALARRLDAAAGFLEVDDVRRAERVLAEAAARHRRHLASNETLRGKQEVLATLVDLRSSTEPVRWGDVRQLEPAGLDASFVARQYLRGVSDRARVEELPAEVEQRANTLLLSEDLVLTTRDLEHLVLDFRPTDADGHALHAALFEERDGVIEAELRPTSLEILR